MKNEGRQDKLKEKRKINGPSNPKMFNFIFSLRKSYPRKFSFDACFHV